MLLRYTLVLGVLSATAIGVGALAIDRASDIYAAHLRESATPDTGDPDAFKPDPSGESATGPDTAPEPPAAAPPRLIPIETARQTDDAPDEPRGSDSGEWVEVTSAVNMRAGPSSSHPVLKVQPVGADLRILSRDGNWLEVEDGEGESTGWVFSRYTRARDRAD